MTKRRTEQLILSAGDIGIWYLSLFVALIIRAGELLPQGLFERHVPLFSWVLGMYLLLAYLFGRYDIDTPFATKKQTLAASITAIGTMLLGSLFFYILPNPSISPKTILVLTIGLAAFGSLLLRYALARIVARTYAPERIGIIGDPGHLDIVEFATSLAANPAEATIMWINMVPTPEAIDTVTTILLHKSRSSDDSIKTLLYHSAVGKKTIVPFFVRYEALLSKIPRGQVSDDWFITNIQSPPRVYDHVRTLLDYLVGLIMSVVLLFVTPFIYIAIKSSSTGPLLIRQTRIGKHGVPFTLYKFRTMYALAPDGSAETSGPLFSTKGDTRITPVGRWLRKTRLDELPQVINLFRRELTIIGPRPERPEIVKDLEAEAPYFSTRTLVMPGITGWAAVKQHYTDTKAATIEKLQYDLYYIKYRSLWLDFYIIILTVRAMITFRGQ